MIDYPLANGGVTRVDAETVELMRGRVWKRIHAGKSGREYVASDQAGDAKPRRLYLHRLVLGVHARSRPVVDHIDGDSLNNTRANLRATTMAVNSQNSQLKSGRKFRGVFAQGAGFVSRVGPEYAGFFKRDWEAALAYDAAARRRYGVNCQVNFTAANDD